MLMPLSEVMLVVSAAFSVEPLPNAMVAAVPVSVRVPLFVTLYRLLKPAACNSAPASIVSRPEL